MTVDLLLTETTLATMDGEGDGPLAGARQGELGLVADAALAIDAGKVTHLGPRDEVLRAVEAEGGAKATASLGGRLVTPGLVDPHTHLVWAGSRADEFALRVAGASYQEIAAAGGGILSTVRATRSASEDELLASLLERIEREVDHGVTTIEVKSGYGLELSTELRQLDAIVAADARHPARLIPTFLGAHAVPPEYADRREAFVDHVVEEMIPAVARRAVRPFVDVFCDEGAFTAAEAERILRAARAAGLPLKAHVDEFARLGFTATAAELGATSCDHLMRAEAADWSAMAASGTVAVLLPGTTVGLGATHFANGGAMISHGVPVALATDWNPGSSPCDSLPLVMALACRYCGLTPAQALVAVTRNAACAVGAGDVAGRLARGRAADLVIMDTDDYRDLAYRFGSSPASAVMIAGAWLRGGASMPKHGATG